MDNNSVGTIIREARKAKRLSQRALCDACGVYPSTISSIERGNSRPHLSTLKKLCAALSIDFEEVSKLS